MWVSSGHRKGFKDDIIQVTTALKSLAIIAPADARDTKATTRIAWYAAKNVKQKVEKQQRSWSFLQLHTHPHVRISFPERHVKAAWLGDPK